MTDWNSDPHIKDSKRKTDRMCCTLQGLKLIASNSWGWNAL